MKEMKKKMKNEKVKNERISNKFEILEISLSLSLSFS